MLFAEPLLNLQTDFGFAVDALALPDGATLVLGGAPRETTTDGVPDSFAQGAAYVHRRAPETGPGTGEWALETRLSQAGVGPQDYTGSAVALASDAEGDAAFAAVWGDRYAYLWRRETPGAGEPPAWVEEQAIDLGAHALALPGSLLAASAPGPAGAAMAGGAPLLIAFGGRVWRRTGTTGDSSPWAFEAQLTPSADGPGDLFGVSVDVAGDLALVGSLADEGPGGRAYVFRYTGNGPLGGWKETAVLEPAVARNRFGRTVALHTDGDGAALAVIRSRYAAHVFARSADSDGEDGTWAERALVVDTTFGQAEHAVTVGAGWGALGNPRDSTRGPDAGLAWLLDLRDLPPVASEPGMPESSETPSLDVWPSPTRAGGTVQVRYSLASAGPVRLSVLDVLGRRVAVLTDEPRAPGEHTASWSVPGGLPGGLYVMRLVAGGASVTRKLLFVR